MVYNAKHMTNPLSQLNDALAIATQVDLCPERTAYLEHLEIPKGERQESWAKRRTALRKSYKEAFHKYFAAENPHLLYEMGEDKTFWEYDSEQGVYLEETFARVRGTVVKLLVAEGFDADATESFAKTVLVRYRAMYQERGVTYDDFDIEDGWFHCANGWVELRTREFEAHSARRLSLRKSAVEFEKGAECPHYDKFIGDDMQLAEDQVRVIDQFSGLCLTGELKHQKMLTILGRPGCGKSTLLEAWGHVLGDTALQWRLTDLGGERARFSGSNFIGKTLCWFDEVDVHKAEMSNNLGTLITGEYVNVERKGINGVVKAKNKVKCVLTANNLPMSAEQGIFRRLILINIPRSFADDGVEDKDMPKKLKMEASGIFNRMLDGLDDLRKMGSFTVISGHEDLIEEYKEQSDVVSEFLSEYFVPAGADDLVSSTVVRNTVMRYFEGNRFVTSLSPQKLGKMLQNPSATRFARMKAVKKTGGKRFWSGLKIRAEYEIDESTELIVLRAGEDSKAIGRAF